MVHWYWGAFLYIYFYPPYPPSITTITMVESCLYNMEEMDHCRMET